MPSHTPSQSAGSATSASVLITAGPTHEPIDAVRYLANRSSGRLGLALADAATRQGCKTTLLLGPTGGPVVAQTDTQTGPANADPEQAPDSPWTLRRFRSSRDLEALLVQEAPTFDVLIMAAAVADYRPATPVSGKLPRTAEGLTLELEPVPDLLATATAAMEPGAVAIGFALEEDATSHDRAMNKMARKGCRAIVLNPLATMDSPDIDATILFADGSPPFSPGPLSKDAFARRLIEVSLGLWARREGCES